MPVIELIGGPCDGTRLTIDRHTPTLMVFVQVPVSLIDTPIYLDQVQIMNCQYRYDRAEVDKYKHVPRG